MRAKADRVRSSFSTHIETVTVAVDVGWAKGMNTQHGPNETNKKRQRKASPEEKRQYKNPNGSGYATCGSDCHRHQARGTNCSNTDSNTRQYTHKPS